MEDRDFYYNILGVTPDADEETIRKAYRKLAVKWHPDKNHGNEEESATMFKIIAEAYDVLSNPEKRRMYDRYGVDGVTAHEQQTSADHHYTNGGQGRGQPPQQQQPFQRSSSRNRRVYDPFAGHHDPNFSFGRAQEIFDSLFADDPVFPFGGAHGMGGMGFDSPFARRGSHGGGPFGASSLAGRVFGGRDPFASVFGGFGDDFGAPSFMGGTGMSSSSSSTSFSSFTSGGGGPGSRTVSTSIRIGPDGRRKTRTETTVVRDDGTRDVHVEEHEDDAAPRLRAPEYQGRGMVDLSGGRRDVVSVDGLQQQPQQQTAGYDRNGPVRVSVRNGGRSHRF